MSKLSSECLACTYFVDSSFSCGLQGHTNGVNKSSQFIELVEHKNIYMACMHFLHWRLMIYPLSKKNKKKNRKRVMSLAKSEEVLL